MKNIVPIGNERQINFPEPGVPTNGVTGDQGVPEITALPNGNFVVVYRNPYLGNFSDLDIMWQEFKPDGTRLTGPTRLAGESINENLGDLAPRSNNGFVAVWTQDSTSAIELALVNPGVFTQPTEVTVVDSAISLFNDPTIATLANGSYFIAYEERVGGITQLRFTIFNATATTKIADNLLLEDGSTSRGAAMPSVAASGNNAIVAFYDANNPSPPEDIRLKMFGPTGALLDTETVANTNDQLLNPDTATLKDGRVVIVWQVNTGTVTNGSEVHGRIYNPATKSFSTGVFNVDVGLRQSDRAKRRRASRRRFRRDLDQLFAVAGRYLRRGSSRPALRFRPARRPATNSSSIPAPAAVRWNPPSRSTRTAACSPLGPVRMESTGTAPASRGG